MIQNTEERLEDFTITYRQEIVFHLRQLINSGERVVVMFDEGRENLLTVLLDLDEESDTLIFDWGGSEAANQRLLNSSRAFFVATPVGVRNQFAATQFWKTTYESRPAFATRIPERFVRLQRRQYFRLTLPMTHRPSCTFLLGDENVLWQMSVVDIGINGVGLETHGAELPFTIGQIIPCAVIDLGKPGKIETDLDVRHYEIISRGSRQVAHMGCRFVSLTPAQELMVQRLIIHIQREERARLG